jgi:hypothetical protein
VSVRERDACRDALPKPVTITQAYECQFHREQKLDLNIVALKFYVAVALGPAALCLILYLVGGWVLVGFKPK